EMVNGPSRDLRISFGRIPAYAVHEEFVHPWESDVPPRLKTKWEHYYFPLLRVGNSKWLASFSESHLVAWPDCTHYRLLTLDQIVDVLCNRAPTVNWVDPENNGERDRH